MYSRTVADDGHVAAFAAYPRLSKRNLVVIARVGCLGEHLVVKILGLEEERDTPASHCVPQQTNGVVGKCRSHNAQAWECRENHFQVLRMIQSAVDIPTGCQTRDD